MTPKQRLAPWHMLAYVQTGSRQLHKEGDKPDSDFNIWYYSFIGSFYYHLESPYFLNKGESSTSNEIIDIFKNIIYKFFR